MRARGPVASGVLAVAVLLVSASGAGADDPSLGAQIDELQATDAAIASKRRSVLLELYGLESKLRRAETRLAALRAESTSVAAREALARHHLAIARQAANTAEAELEERLRALYMEGDVDPLALLLGAGSLDEAITTLDHLDRLAGQDKAIIAQTKAARATLRRAVAELAARQAQLQAVTSQLEATRSALVAAQTERKSYLASLASRRRVTQDRIAALTEQASVLSAQSTPSGGGSPGAGGAGVEEGGEDGGGGGGGGGPVSGSRRLTVTATGYSLSGTTATGVPVGWGVVAVDPAVIPLGTSMTIPGYGEGVAADTGSAVMGYTIDLWFPTRAQALAWGRRTVTITIH